MLIEEYNDEQQEVRYRKSFTPAMRQFAHLISVLFHPLFLLSYGFLLLAWSNSYLFGKTSFAKVLQDPNFNLTFLRLVLFSIVVPMLSIGLMRALNLISHISLPSRQERIAPFMTVGMFYMVLFVNYNNDSIIPIEFKIFSLGATISIFLAFIINLFSKISIHTVGMGGFLAMVFLIIGRSHADNEYIFMLTILACGLVGTSRLILRAHEPMDVYGGYFIGFFSQLVALNILYTSPDVLPH